MKKSGLIGLLICIFFLTLFAIVSMGAKPKSSYAVKNNVDPRIYMPLAVGNSWTYVWKNKVISDLKEPETKRKGTVFWINRFFEKGKPNIYYGQSFLYELSTFEDTYSIYRQDQNHFFFNISCSGKDCEYHTAGDSRFKHSLEQAWTWTDTNKAGQLNIVLTETLKTDVLNPKAKDDISLAAVDNRNIIHVVKKNNAWYNWNMVMSYGNSFNLEYDFKDHSVEVPAGKFEQCILIKEMYHGEFHGRVIDFAVYKYFAPNIGMVKEYQQLADGTITYTMELEKYNLAQTKKE